MRLLITYPRLSSLGYKKKWLLTWIIKITNLFLSSLNPYFITYSDLLKDKKRREKELSLYCKYVLVLLVDQILEWVLGSKKVFLMTSKGIHI